MKFSIATVKMSHHFSDSILGGVSATSQYDGSPAKADGPLEAALPLIQNLIAAPCYDLANTDNKEDADRAILYSS